MTQYTSTSHWRDSARSARFFMIDARAALPLVVFLLNIQWWTFLLALLAFIFFATIERFGFTVNVFLRWFRSFIAGPVKTAKPWWQ